MHLLQWMQIPSLEGVPQAFDQAFAAAKGAVQGHMDEMAAIIENGNARIVDSLVQQISDRLGKQLNSDQDRGTMGE